MKILVTGSNGFLGQKITQRFLERCDFELVATAKGADRFASAGTHTYITLDITDADQLHRVLEAERPDALINTAALALPDVCERERARCDALNADAVGTLARVCASLGIHLIHVSTDFIFDGAAGPYREGDSPAPVSYYGGSKLAGEMRLRESAAKWSIVRTVLVYGALPGAGRSNIVLWVKSSLEAGKPIRVVADQWRTPTLAEDLADACIEVALRGTEGIYHVSGEEFMSVMDLARRVAAFWKLDDTLISAVTTAELNELAQRPLITGFDIAKAKRDLGFQPRSLEAGFELIAKQLDEKFSKNIDL